MKKTDHKKQWKINVKKARLYVRDYDKSRWIIAQLANEVCVEGKNKHKEAHGQFTYRNFARQIDLNYKTLLDWCRIKKQVVDKLPSYIKNNADKFLYAHFKECSELVDPKDSPNLVRQKFKTVVGANPTHRKFKKYISHLSAIHYNSINPVLLNDVSDEQIQAVISYCKEIVEKMELELDYRRKYPDEPHKKTKAPNVVVELEKRLRSR